MSRLSVGHRLTRKTCLGLVLLLVACDSAQVPELTFDHAPDAAWAPRAGPIPATSGDLALVTNNRDDTVSYVDLGRDPPVEIFKLPVGLQPIEREGPHHVTLSADGATMWIGLSNFVPGSGSGPHGAHGTGTADGHALLVDVDSGDLLADVRVDRNPGDIRLTPDGKRLLVTHFDLLRITEATPGTPPADLASRLVIIDVATRTRLARVSVCPAAHGMVVSPDSRRVTIACWDDQIAIVDLAGLPDQAHPVRLVPVLPLPGTIADPDCQPYALTQSPDGDTVWVGCFESGELRAYDVSAGVMDPARAVDLGSAALFGSYLSDTTLVVPSQGPDQLTWLDENGDVQDTLTFDRADCILPHVVHPSSDGRTLYLVCEGDRVTPGTLVVIDAARHTVTSVVALGLFPDDLAIRSRAK